MNLSERIECMVALGQLMQSESEVLTAVKQHTEIKNPWFTEKNISCALQNISERFLQKALLEEWIRAYPTQTVQTKRIGLILAGNIPLVGFHDLLCVFISGHTAVVKLSEKDNVLLPWFLEELVKKYPALKERITIVDKLSGYDAVIATGSNNTIVQFEYYFRNVPKLLRNNRNAVALLDGNEDADVLRNLGKDLFDYFGLGCRNVSKIYVPKDYNVEPLMEVLHEYRELILHSKYKNNFDYNYAIFLMNQDKFFMNGAFILREHKDIASRISSVHYEEYAALPDAISDIKSNLDKIQCIVTNAQIDELETVPIGMSQTPELNQYADGLDTMSFLTKDVA